jgi:hypothetical protein
MSIYVVALFLQFSLGYSRRVHYYLSRAFNRIKKIFRLNYHTKEESKYKYRDNAHIKLLFASYLKNKKLLFKISFMALFAEIAGYISTLTFFAAANAQYALNINY